MNFPLLGSFPTCDIESIFTPSYKQMKWEGKVKACSATVRFCQKQDEEKLPVLKLHKRLFGQPETPKERAYLNSVSIK